MYLQLHCNIFENQISFRRDVGGILVRISNHDSVKHHAYKKYLRAESVNPMDSTTSCFVLLSLTINSLLCILNFAHKCIVLGIQQVSQCLRSWAFLYFSDLRPITGKICQLIRSLFRNFIWKQILKVLLSNKISQFINSRSRIILRRLLNIVISKTSVQFHVKATNWNVEEEQ